VPSFGDPAARLLIVGLAPAAHGANRTGRMFTGDRSGDFLYAALHRAGLASQSRSERRDDGLRLTGVYITAALHCAPPGNRPTREQLTACSPWLREELEILRPPVAICLGGVAWNAALRALQATGGAVPRPKPKFAHGAECEVGSTTLLGCYHVSQQNTFTGRLTEPMLDAVLRRATAKAHRA
jgi:uracil-DNA glycosylase family 4